MSTIQVDRIIPYQSSSVTIEGDVTVLGAATTGSNTFTGNQNIQGTITASIAEGFALVGGVGNVSTLVATSSFGGALPSGVVSGSSQLTASYDERYALSGSGGGGVVGAATTGSNTFTGDQTLIDASGNTITLSDASGSLMLVAKTFTSASSHLTASAGNQVNIIFKNNDNTADTIISGSNNIFTNPTAAGTGFKRVIGSNNIVNSATGMPQVTGSSAATLAITSNYFGTNGGVIRATQTGSTYTISNNIANGTINLGGGIGAGAMNDFSRAQGATVSGNFINGTLNFFAGAITGLPIIATIPNASTNIINGFTTATMNSSSVALNSNIINSPGLAITNNYFSGSAGSGSLSVSSNLIGGRQNATILVQGSNPAGTTTAPFIGGNIIYGTANAIHINADNSRTSSTTLYASMECSAVIGNTLAVTGSSVISDLATVGSAFVGRFNANDGIRNKTSDIVFAVGTGTATGTRKTGLLVDSGSNTFVEGTLNVSGSSSFTGSVGLSTALTLAEQDPLPAGGVGQLAVSSSNLYYHNGSGWTQIN